MLARSSVSLMLVLALNVSAAHGQQVCGLITPNVFDAGTVSALNFVLQDAGGAGFETYGGCAAYRINVGFPGGPPPPIPIGLCGGFTPVPANGSATDTVNFVGGLAAGLYYIESQVRPLGGGPVTAHFFPFTVNTPGDPTFTSATTPRVGMSWILDIAASADPLAPAFVAGSFTTNSGFTAGPVFISLDQDALFSLTYPAPLAGIFQNFASITDAAGNMQALVNIPNDPALVNLPLNFQAIIIPLAGAPKLTNTITGCIAP